MSRTSRSTCSSFTAATPGDGSFASNCLLARRLAERGVRFIHLYHRGWDHHGNLERDIRKCADHTDRGAYALITDLKQRGMLDDTLVIWGGEFGRTPMVQAQQRRSGPRPSHQRLHDVAGRRRHQARHLRTATPTSSATTPPKNVVHVRDLHATMLHLLGIDHKKLSVKYQGLDMKLTGVEEAKVVKGILA